MIDNKPKDFKARKYKVKNGSWTIFDGLCKGCGLCLNVCPYNGLFFSKKYKGIYNTPAVEVNLKECQVCGNCEQICPESAIAVYKNKT